MDHIKNIIQSKGFNLWSNVLDLGFSELNLYFSGIRGWEYWYHGLQKGPQKVKCHQICSYTYPYFAQIISYDFAKK